MRFTASVQNPAPRYHPGGRPQRDCVLDVLRFFAREGEWASLEEMGRVVGMKDGAVGSRIRDLRVEGRIIERCAFFEKSGRVFKYKLKLRKNES